jgi:hypothetical protein
MSCDRGLLGLISNPMPAGDGDSIADAVAAEQADRRTQAWPVAQ